MSQVSIDQAIGAALQQHQGGRMAEAERLYRAVLAAAPEHPAALHLLGTLCGQTGRGAESVDLLQRAIERGGPTPAALSDLGNALASVGRDEEAIGAYGRAVELAPAYMEGWINLGNLLSKLNRVGEARAAFERVMLARPRDAALLNSAGVGLFRCDAIEAATECHRAALAISPDDPSALSNLGTALLTLGRADEAISALEGALRLKPGLFEAHVTLGSALFEVNRLEEALRCFNTALALRPGEVHALLGVGNIMQASGQIYTAIEALERGVASDPRHSGVRVALGRALKDAGRLDDAYAQWREALRIEPRLQVAHSNLVYTMHFDERVGPKELLEAHRQWARQQAGGLGDSIRPHENDRDSDRRLRIGYVSGDFRFHPVGRFMLALMENHDHRRFEVVCFSNAMQDDALTGRLRQCADRWHRATGLSDEALAELIRAERIDILVDLSLHLAQNRLLAFARKPAPVQVTYLAYPSTSGLAEMDYRLTDDEIDPPGAEENYTERSVRLKHYWCYRPPATALEPVAPPSRSNGFVTFGCLNNFTKVSDAALATWRKLLDETPGARMLLLSGPGEHRRRASDALGEGRVDFVRLVPFDEYLATYQRIDIALDPFPYVGGTTTCDALWMGVAVVTLAGRTAVGRGGASLLRQVGLGELIAHSRDEYVRIAAELARDGGRLAGLCAGMRKRMLASALCDGAGFARDVEAKFRWMWTKWCGAEV